MGETKVVDIRPYLAAAIARNSRAYARGRTLYNKRPAECEAESHKSGCKNHRAITSCRAEYEIKARQMLGVLCLYDEQDVTSVLAHGWRQIYSAIKNDKPINTKQYASDDDEAADVLFVAAYFSLVLNKELSKDMQKIMAELTQTYDQNPAETYVSPADIMTGETWYPARASGTAALDGVLDSEKGEAFEILAYMMGMDLADYLYGINLSKEEKGACVVAADGLDYLARPLAYFAMLIKAIKADRRYLLNTHSEKLIIDAQTARTEAAQSREDATSAKKQLERELLTISNLREQINALESDKRKLSAELAEHDGDAQELAALRSALYDAEQEQPESVDLVPAIPFGLRIVCMGGHPHWIAQMKKILPDITYIGLEVSFDEQTLRNADAVWFRADYIPHKSYTPAITICRKAGVPVYYFPPRFGADKCAVEVCAQMNEMNRLRGKRR